MLKNIFKFTLSSSRKFCCKPVLAFSLAEATITLAVLGIIAAITIPLVYNRSVDSKRTKIKKAMEVYSNAVNIMYSENNLKPNTDFIDGWGSNNDCANVRQYFKIIQNGDTQCQFKTSDGLWWSFGPDNNDNINGRLSKAIVAFNKNDLTKNKAVDEESNDAFFFMTQFDEKKRPRIFDVSYSNYVGWSANIINNAKVYAFINKKDMIDYYNFCSPCRSIDKECKSCINKECDGDKCILEYFGEAGNFTGYRGCRASDLKGCGGQYRVDEIPNFPGHFSGNCDVQGTDCNFYIMKYNFDVKPTPFYKINGKTIYGTFKKFSDYKKYTSCDFDNRVTSKCTGEKRYLSEFKDPDKPDAYLKIYYKDKERTQIDNITYVYPNEGSSVGITRAKYKNCVMLSDNNICCDCTGTECYKKAKCP